MTIALTFWQRDGSIPCFMKISAIACGLASGLALSRLPISMAQACSVGSVFCLLRQIRKALMAAKMARIRRFMITF